MFDHPYNSICEQKTEQHKFEQKPCGFHEDSI